MKTRILTVEYPTLVSAVKTKILVTVPTNSTAQGAYKAIWDTGATNTVISQQVIEELGLEPIGVTLVNTSGGIRQTYTYLIHLTLENQVRFQHVRVTEGSIYGADVLIGMDVITQGDLAITNKDHMTTFSFRIPSIEKIDFGQTTKKASQGK
jgi:predicted aspartyl protease